MPKIIIIGGGPGGYHTAIYAAKNGLEVTLFEKEYLGGTCLNSGCIPTKTLCHEAEKAALLRQYGITPDLNAAIDRKNAVVEQLRQGVETLLQNSGVTVIKAEAKFKNRRTVIADGKEYDADFIIIATGSSSKMPPADITPSPLIMTSTEMLNVRQMPRRLCIIGAGVIGMEFASIFHRMGTEVTVIEFLKECLPAIDSEIAKRVRKLMEKRGMTFIMQAALKSAKETADGSQVTVAYERKGKVTEEVFDAVLIATGRKPNVEGLGLENAKVEYSEKGIVVSSSTYQTSSVSIDYTTSHIYAIGDVNANTMLAHAAIAQGIKAVDHIMGKENNIFTGIMPAAVFTDPEVASVGGLEDELITQGLPYAVQKAYLRANGRALANDDTEGMVKLFYGTEDGQIFGCHAYGSHAADMIQEVAALMNAGATISDLRNTIHIHPTIAETLQEAALST